MKKHVCILIAFLLFLMFASCDPKTSDDTSSAPESSVDTSAVSEIQSADDSQTKPDESREVSGPTSEEGDISGPQLSIDPEGFPYRLVRAHNANELADKLIALNDRLNSSEAQEANAADIDWYSELGKIMSAGYIFNPSYDGFYAENEDPTSENSQKIEMFFDADKCIAIVYYCKNDYDATVQVQVTYPNQSMANLITKHGIDGYRMYYDGVEKPLAQYSKDEISEFGCKNVELSKIDFCGGKYDAIKYVQDKTTGENIASFMYEGVIVTVSYQYRNEEVAATHDADEMLDLIKMEKVKFD